MAVIPGDGIGRGTSATLFRGMLTTTHNNATYHALMHGGLPNTTEVVPAALKVLDALVAQSKGKGPTFTYVPLEAGWETFQKTGNALPQATVDGIATCQTAIFGAVSSPSHQVKGYSSPIVALRKKINLFANLRPCVSAPIPGIQPGIDMMIVRENTECLYVKRETLSADGNTAIAERQSTC